MSELGKYELEDIVWESSDNDDHIVPYGGDKKIGYPSERESFNKPRIELKCTETNPGILSASIAGRKGETSYANAKDDEKTTLEKSPWTPSSKGGSCLSTNVKSANSELCTDDPNLVDRAFDVENNLQQYQLNDGSRNEKDQALLGNGDKDKGSSDLMFYSWPELENFEDLDNMFRDCDPSFSLNIDNSDDLSWLSSSHMIDGPNGAVKSSFDLSGPHPSGQHSVTEQLHGQSSDGMSVDESNKQVESARLNEVGEANHLLNSQHNFSPENQRPDISHQPCFQTPITMINPNCHSSDHVLPSSTPSTIKSEVGVLPTISPRQSSHASNQMKSTESYRDVSFKNLPCSENKKKGKLHHRKLSRHAQKSNLRIQRVDSNIVGIKNPSPRGECETEGQSEVDDCEIGFSGELDSSILQGGSCMSSVKNEAAVDASTLKQLQYIMGQLDIRTKLCIRDSLYRLARSAAQRHYCDNQGSDGGDGEDSNGAMLSGTNKCTGFIDMETDTNPIDRSIAHLLFHRPSDPSASAAPVDAVPAKSHIMVKEPNPLTAGKPAFGEETTLLNEDCSKQRN